MYPFLWFWSPTWNLPGSGSVAQRIAPNTNWFFDGIDPAAGNGRIERKAFDVASYGRQLGWITEVLLAVADGREVLPGQAAESLEELKRVRARIEEIKREEEAFTATDIEHRLVQLKRRSPEEFARLKLRLRRLMEDEDA